MANKILILAALLLTLGLKAQNVFYNQYGDSTRIYIVMPVSELKLSDEGSTEYRLSLNLLNSKGNSLHQSFERLLIDKDKNAYVSQPLFTITKQLATGSYALITNLENLRFGDKTERNYIVNIETNKKKEILTAIVSENNDFTFLPADYTELNQKVSACGLILDTFSVCDSIVLKANIDDSLHYFRIEKDNGYEYDLMPILAGGVIRSLELMYYTGNIIASTDWLFYKPVNRYSSLYSLQDQLGQIKYIASQNEWRQIKKIAAKNESKAVEYFWDRHDTTPDNAINDFRELFYGRILKADELFTIHKKMPGWKSDRGRIFIRKGPPDDISEENFPIGQKPYIIWRYFSDNTIYRFVDKSGYGNFTLEDESYEF